MRIVFVYREGVSLGIGYLSSYIQQFGHEVDLAFEHRTFANMYINLPFFKKIEETLEDCVNNAVAKNPDIAAFSVATADYQWALETATKIKSRINVPIIFGGYHPTLLPQICIEQEQVDMICLGEGEFALAELLNSMQSGKIDYAIRNLWFKHNGSTIRNELRPFLEDLDILPFPDRDIFFQYFPAFYKREIGFVLASRGCPFACSYCGNDAYNELYKNKGKVLRLRSPDNVIAECLFLKNKYGIKKIHFQDDLFASHTSWLENFIPEYKKKICLPFTCLTHPKVMSRRNIKLLKEGGCRLAIVGIQSGSERIRREIFNRRETNDEIVRFAQDCHRVGLNFSFNHIFDAPGDREKEIFETAEFYNRIRPKIIDSYCLVYFPKAEIIKTAIQDKILTTEDTRLIEEGKFKGLHQGGFYNVFGNYYKKYALLFVLIPLLPPWLVSLILRKRILLNLVLRLPIQLMPLVKTFLNLRCGSASFHFMAICFNLYRFSTLFIDYLFAKKQKCRLKNENSFFSPLGRRT